MVGVSDTQVFHDYEFHFANGKQLEVTLLIGRDLSREDDDLFYFLVYAPEREHEMTIRKCQLDAWEKRQRIEKPTGTPGFESHTDV